MLRLALRECSHSQFPIQIAVEFEWILAFEEADELFGGKDWLDFEVIAFYCKFELLAGSQIELLANLLWYDDLEFVGKS